HVATASRIVPKDAVASARCGFDADGGDDGGGGGGDEEEEEEEEEDDDDDGGSVGNGLDLERIVGVEVNRRRLIECYPKRYDYWLRAQAPNDAEVPATRNSTETNEQGGG